MRKANSLAIKRPDIALQWHPTKNGDLLPENFTEHSGVKVWWKCDKNPEHEWDAKICHRVDGSGCPICAGQKAWKGNNLALSNPDLANEWHPIKNENLTPYEVLPKSNKKVWWICNKKHEWQAAICDRSHGNSCPYCSGQKVCLDNCLATLRPDLVRQWHYLKNVNVTPYDVTLHSDQRVWWKCHLCGYEWELQVKNRVNSTNTEGCPSCGSYFSFPEECIYFYIRKIFKNAVNKSEVNGKEIDVYIPDLKIGIEYDGYVWHKTREKEDINKNKVCYENGIKLIRIREAGLTLLTDYNTKNIIAPNRYNMISMEEIIKSIYELILEMALSEGPSPSYSKKILENMHKIDIKHDTISIYNMSAKKIIENSLQISNPELSEEWHPTKNVLLKPTNVTKGSHKIVCWKCKKCSYEWKSSINNRVKGRSCPNCSGKIINKNNSLASVRPDLLEEWNFIKNESIYPENMFPYSHTKVWWKCKKCGFEWETPIAKRTAGRNCPKCAGNIRKTIDEIKELIEKRGGTCLSEEYTNSITKLKIRCKKGHIFEKDYTHLKRGQWCHECRRLGGDL